MGGGDLKGGGGGGKEVEGRGVEKANVFRELEGTSVDCHQGTGQLFVKKNNFFWTKSCISFLVLGGVCFVQQD